MNPNTKKAILLAVERALEGWEQTTNKLPFEIKVYRPEGQDADIWECRVTSDPCVVTYSGASEQERYK